MMKNAVSVTLLVGGAAFHPFTAEAAAPKVRHSSPVTGSLPDASHLESSSGEPVSVAIERAAPVMPVVKSVRIEAVELEGNHAFTASQLQSVLAEELPREMTLADMKKLAGVLTAYYHQNGYQLARVMVPRQDFVDNKPLRLTVLEGWVDTIDQKGARRLKPSLVQGILGDAGVKPGEPFRMSDLEIGMVRLNRLYGIQAASVLRSGAQLGSTTVAVNLVEGPRYNGVVEVNNYGSKNTGETRLQASVGFDNLTGRGDQLGFQAVKSVSGSGTFNFRASYARPLNTSGLSAVAYASTGNINVGGQFSILNIQGDTRTFGAGLRKEWIKGPTSILALETWLEALNLNQTVLGVTTVEDAVRKVRIGLSYETRDNRSKTVAGVAYHHGLGTLLGGMPNNSPLSSRAFSQADNSFDKISIDAARIFYVTPRLNTLLQVSGQYAVVPLVATEQWGIGGFGSVVGHAPSFFVGDSGLTLSTEGRYLLRPALPGLQLILRADHGMVFVKRPFLGQKSSDQLSGASIGVGYSSPSFWDVRFDLARGFGDDTGGNSAYFQTRIRF